MESFQQTLWLGVDVRPGSRGEDIDSWEGLRGESGLHLKEMKDH